MPVQMGNQKVKTLCYNIIGDTVLSLCFCYVFDYQVFTSVHSLPVV
jgi:hypothetical protein